MHGIGNTWWLFDGRKERMLRAGVPEELRNLEVLQGWSAELIEDRMRTGTNPFSYEARNAWGQ